MDFYFKWMIRCLLYLHAVDCYVSQFEETPCTTLETNNGVFYFVPTSTDPGCSYSWSNSSGYVLATDDGRIDKLIIDSNATFLHTSSCHETLEYFNDCMPRVSKKATCSANCTRSTFSTGEGMSSMRWFIPVIAVLSLLATAGILYFVSVFCLKTKQPSERVDNDRIVYQDTES